MSRAINKLKVLSALASVNRKAALFIAAVGLFFLSSVLFLGAAESKLAKKKAALSSFESMKAEYERSLSDVGVFREKLASGMPASALEAVQAAAEQAGIKKKIGQLKPFEVGPARGFRQSGAEVRLEGVDIGQLVTFLYGLEKGKFALITDELRMKASFENPDALEVRARIRLIARE